VGTAEKIKVFWFFSSEKNILPYPSWSFPRMLKRSLLLFATLCATAHAAPLQVDATGCLHVSKTGPSGTCTTPSSLTIDLENTCKIPIKAQLCLRGANHLWVACAAEESLAPQKHFFQSSCDSDGDYTYWGCSQLTVTGKCGGDDLIGKATNAPKPK
jgi:hypothetical protein